MQESDPIAERLRFLHVVVERKMDVPARFNAFDDS